MSSSSLDEAELRKKLLLMQQFPTMTVNTSPPDLVERFSAVVPVIKTPTLHLKVTAVKVPAKATEKKGLPVHDWGPFGTYEYLGPGTPYTAKQKAGILPVNQLDKISMYHDSQYKWTGERTLPGTALVTSGIRGLADYGAGAAMVTAAFNPWSGLGFSDRVLGLVAGDLLMTQGFLRLNPITMGPMAIIDAIFY